MIINGDILTAVNFRAMFDFHAEHEADMTVGIRKYEFQVPYGVIECGGHRICGLQEKPLHQFFVNAGIYLLQPSMLAHIPTDRPYDVTDIIKDLVLQHKNVVSFPIIEYWIDIGQHDDYKKANSDYSKTIENE